MMGILKKIIQIKQLYSSWILFKLLFRDDDSNNEKKKGENGNRKFGGEETVDEKDGDIFSLGLRKRQFGNSGV